MKTPHRITLIRNLDKKDYDPVTDTYKDQVGNKVEVACLVNFINQVRVFQEYGSRTDKIMICRFQQEQEPFDKAIYNGSYYVPIDSIDAPIKGAVRLKEVQE